MSGIGIIGCGISGLQLALFLQQRGVQTTLYAPTPMAQMIDGPVQNFVTRWAPTLERERSLGLADPDAQLATRARVQVVGTRSGSRASCPARPTPPTSGCTCPGCWTPTWRAAGTTG